MLRATVKSLLARKLRLLSSGFAIVLSVMFISATFVFTDTIDASFDRMVDQVVAEGDVVVSPAAQTAPAGPAAQPGPAGPATPAGPGTEDVRPSIPGNIVEAIRKTPGVESATATIAGYNTNELRILGRDGRQYPGKDHSQLVQNWTGEPGTLAGRPPAADGEAVINETLAKTGSLAPGDQVTLRDAKKQPVVFTVVGVFTPKVGSGARRALGLYLTDPTAQRLLLDGADAYQEVRAQASPQTNGPALREQLRAALGPGYTVETGRDAAADQIKALKDGLNGLRTILLGFAGFALFIGTFLIFNTFSILVAQRLRELALLRALGASRAQVHRSVLVEAVVLATAGSLVGFGLGCGLGWLGARFAAEASASIEIGTVEVTPAAVVVCFAVGILTTVVSAFVPALRAARIPPVAALRVTQASDRPMRRLTIAGTVIGVGSTATMLYSASKGGVNDGWVLLTFVGALLFLLGLALCTPFLTSPLGGAIGRLFSWSEPGRLGQLNAARKPRRTAITAAAMMIGVAVIAMFGTGFASSAAEVGRSLETSLRADLIMRPTGEVNGVLDQDLVDRVAAIPSVRTVVTHGGFNGRINGSSSQSWVTWYGQQSEAHRLLSTRAKLGRVESLQPGEVALASSTAKTTKLTVGARITIADHDRGEATYQVVGIFADHPALYDYYIAAEDPMASSARSQVSWQYDEVYLEVAPGAEADVRAAIDSILANEPEVTVQTRQQYIAGLVDNNDTGMIILQVMMGFALLIASLGVVNTMMLSVIERTRELGTLRTIGLSRRQATHMIAVEAVVVSLLGAVLGIAAGVGLACLLQKSQGGMIVIPWLTLVCYLLGAVVVGLVAAIVPAIRAGRLNLLAAIGYE